jgi:cytosine/adenosine deaminase-related metal-dependent hydrolase
VNVGLGVDGSASNDGSHLLAEVRQAMLLARVQEGVTGYSRSDDPGRRLMTARGAVAGHTMARQSRPQRYRLPRRQVRRFLCHEHGSP